MPSAGARFFFALANSHPLSSPNFFCFAVWVRLIFIYLPPLRKIFFPPRFPVFYMSVCPPKGEGDLAGCFLDPWLILSFLTFFSRSFFPFFPLWGAPNPKTFPPFSCFFEPFSLGLSNTDPWPGAWPSSEFLIHIPSKPLFRLLARTQFGQVGLIFPSSLSHSTKAPQSPTGCSLFFL